MGLGLLKEKKILRRNTEDHQMRQPKKEHRHEPESTQQKYPTQYPKIINL